MNIFELATIVCVPVGAALGYQWASPYGVTPGVVAVGAGAVAGYFAGPLLALVALAPFQAVAWLWRRRKRP